MFYLLCEKSDVSRLITPPSQMQLTCMVFKREKKRSLLREVGGRNKMKPWWEVIMLKTAHCSIVDPLQLDYVSCFIQLWVYMCETDWLGGRMEVIMPGDGWSVKKAKTFFVWMNVFGVDKILFVPFFFISFFFLENIWTFILNNTQKSYGSNEYHLPLIRLFEFYKSPFIWFIFGFCSYI